MKPKRDAVALAARLSAAAATPVPLPSAPEQKEDPQTADSLIVSAAPKARRGGIAKTAANKNTAAGSRPITLRPTPELLNRYVLAAAERTRESGRVVSAQEVMIDVLERGL